MTSLFRNREECSGIDLIHNLYIENMEFFYIFLHDELNRLEFSLSRIVSKNFKVKEMLMITLRYLPTGDLLCSFMRIFKISKQLITRIVPEVSSAIVEHLVIL